MNTLTLLQHFSFQISQHIAQKDMHHCQACIDGESETDLLKALQRISRKTPFLYSPLNTLLNTVLFLLKSLIY